MPPRLYLPQATSNSTCYLPAQQSHYLLRVLRMKPKDVVHVFDGNGGEYAAIIITADKKGVELHVDEKISSLMADSDICIHIAQAVCASAKMDWAVEKMTELGAARITPLTTAHTNNIRAPIARWQRLSTAASGQCGRATVPVVDSLITLSDFLAQGDSKQKILLSPRAKQHLSVAYQSAQPAIFLFGPESGLTNTEEEQCLSAGFTFANLGTRILRAETAALAALAMVSALSD
jgi:16S rRNA (uracil1498-N3)-methyltransferase